MQRTTSSMKLLIILFLFCQIFSTFGMMVRLHPGIMSPEQQEKSDKFWYRSAQCDLLLNEANKALDNGDISWFKILKVRIDIKLAWMNQAL